MQFKTDTIFEKLRKRESRPGPCEYNSFKTSLTHMNFTIPADHDFKQQ